jgi:superoxide reductase
MSLSQHIRSADWKSEKHAPAIDCPDKVVAGRPFTVSLGVGKEIGHPNTTEHHIRWIELHYRPASGNFSFDLGRFDFNAHGESPRGANEGPAYTVPAVTVTAILKEGGTLHALSYCNIHGLWESSKPITVEQG